MPMIEYRVTGMTCGHCEQAVGREVALVNGVDAVRVSADSGVLQVTSAVLLDDDAVIVAVDEAGYAAERIR